MGLIRSVITLGIVFVLVFIGATVPLGERTFFGHVKRIWSADETQSLVEGVKEKSGPVVERVKRGVAAATSDDDDDGDPAAKPDASPTAEKP